MGKDGPIWTPEYWNWKHSNNPFGVSAVLVAEQDGLLVGLRAFMRWDWQPGQQRIHSVRAVDTATHPDFQGRGIFKRLTLQLREEVEREGVGFIYNTPNSKSRPGYLKMGWSDVGRPTLWVRPVQPWRLVKSYLGKGLQGAEVSAPTVDAMPAAAALDLPGVSELIDAVAAERLAEFHTPVSARYLQWRYVEIPAIEYYALAAGKGDEGALLIFRTRQRGALRELRICELLVTARRASQRHARSLLKQVGRVADVDVVIVMNGGSLDCSRLLLRCGYVPLPRTGPRLTAYAFAPSPSLSPTGGEGLVMPDPRRLGSWRATIGDLELF